MGATISKALGLDIDYDRLNKYDSYERACLQAFDNVLEAVDLEALTHLAVQIRSAREKLDSVTCKPRLDLRKTGRFNLVFLLEFSDDVYWLVRLPGHAMTLNDQHACKMDSEYSTMQYVRRHGILAPEVYYWTTKSNQIGVPFALIEVIKGAGTLHHVWQQKNCTHEQRLRLLTQLAEQMSKLYALQFCCQGALNFNEDGTVKSSGPWMVFGKTFPDEHRADDLPWSKLLIQKPESLIYAQRQWLRIAQGLANIKGESIEIHDLYRVLIDSVPSFMKRAPMTLAHADLDTHNILVDDDLQLRAIIDWDEVSVQPAYLGSAMYPKFIKTDWEHGESFPHSGLKAEDLPRYRRHYHEAWTELHDTQPHLQNFDQRWLRFSHLMSMFESHLYNEETLQDLGERILRRSDMDCAFEDLIRACRKKTDDAYVLKAQWKRAVLNLWKPGAETLPDLDLMTREYTRADFESCHPNVKFADPVKI